MNDCVCSGTPPVGVPFPYFAAFTVSPPVIPDYYWNVYSQEERIKAICQRLETVVKYLDEMTTEYNKLYAEVQEIKGV